MPEGSLRSVLLFEDLLPRPRDGDIAPCRAVLQTTGKRGGESLLVVMMDRGVALQAARTGGWAKDELEQALLHAPSEIGIDAEEDAADLLRLLGSRPRLTSTEPIVIDDYADLTGALLMNGLQLTERASPRCVRPGVANPLQLDERGLERVFERHREQTRELPSERARAISIVGTSWLANAAHRKTLAGAVLDGGFRLANVSLVSGTPVSALAALRFLVELGLRAGGAAPEVSVADAATPELAQLTPALEGSLGLDTLERIDQAWRSEPRTPEAWLRRSDDAVRRACFSAISASRERHSLNQEQRAVEAATSRLGPPPSWIKAYRQVSREWRPRLVMIPTWQCELRCKYCRIPKQDGRVMPLETVDRTLDLLLSSDAEELDLHFFGGEPLVAWDVIQHTLSTGHARAQAEGRRIRFLFTTNGWALSRERFDWLTQFPVWFQLSLDGDAATQNAIRPALRLLDDSYERSPATKSAWFRQAGVDHHVVQVVAPTNVGKMAENFRHILSLDYRRIQLNYALGTLWERPAIEEFGRQLALVADELETRWRDDVPVELVNLKETLLPVRGNLEITVDWDGSVFGCMAFLVSPKHREDFRLGHLDDGRCLDRYQCDGFEMDHLISNWFTSEMADNNRKVGSVLMSFVRFMRNKHPELDARG